MENLRKRTILTSQAPQPIGPYQQAVEVGLFVFCSGQVALDPSSGQLLGQDVEAQTRQVLKNLGAVLRAADLSYRNVVKTTVFLKSMGDFPQFNKVYAEFFEGNATPARSTVEVARLPKDALVEIEAIAVRTS